MKIPCPNCDKMLAVADELAGRRVKCPGCQQIFQLPPSTGVALGPTPKPMPAAASIPPLAAKTPASLPTRDAVQTVATPPRPSRGSCPDCGEILAVGAAECPMCDWTSDRPAANASRQAADGTGGCYILIHRDEVHLTWAIEKRMKKFIETEQIDMRVMGENELPPDRLGPNDLVISGKVNQCEYGSRFVRYWLTFVAMCGPGSCRLNVAAEVESAEGDSRRIKSYARQAIGFLGGSGPNLMKRNVQIVSTRIAKGAARHATGKSFLNAQAYNCGFWSLGLGLASLLPFVGILLGLIGLVVGFIALMTINRRRLPRGKGVAIAGIVLAFVGFAVNAGVILLASQN